MSQLVQLQHLIAKDREKDREELMKDQAKEIKDLMKDREKDREELIDARNEFRTMAMLK